MYEPCESCGKPVTLHTGGWVESLGKNIHGVEMLITHTPARCREARHSNIIREGDIVAISFSSIEAFKAWPKESLKVFKSQNGSVA